MKKLKEIIKAGLKDMGNDKAFSLKIQQKNTGCLFHIQFYCQFPFLYFRSIQIYKELIIQRKLILSRVRFHILQFNLIFIKLSQSNTI